jgi:D-alanine-D-alanine ligase-like ATP-grasp enzyme
VKPNEGSEGKGVQLVGSFDALFDALFALFKENPRVLVQRPVGGRDYRVVVLDDEVISAYERLPLRVTGDGVNTLGSLASSKIEALGAPGRGPKVARSDPRIGQNIAAQGWAFDDVVAVGKVIDLLPNANLSTGGEARDITGVISPGLKKVCRSATRTLGLTFAGVDIRSEDATDEHADYTILEVNAAPGLHNFATLGAAQEENVRMLYAKLMAYLAKNS